MNPDSRLKPCSVVMIFLKIWLTTITMFSGHHLKPRFNCKWCTLNVLSDHKIAAHTKCTSICHTNISKTSQQWSFVYTLETRFKVKEHLDNSRVFTGSPNTYLVRLTIVKACEAKMDPKEDMAGKKFHLPAESLFMMARIWLLELVYLALGMAAT